MPDGTPFPGEQTPVFVFPETGESPRDADRLERAFGALPPLVAAVQGPEHVIDFVNSNLADLLGGRPTVGYPAAIAIPEIVDEGFVGQLDRVYATGEPFAGREIPVRIAAPGHPAEDRFFDLVFQPVPPNGPPDGILVHAVDVTDRVRRRRARERTAERAQRRLKRLQDIATSPWPRSLSRSCSAS